MRRLRCRRGLALLISCVLAIGTCFHSGPVSYQITSYADERPATVNATNLNVRSGAGTTYPSVAKLSHGTAVTVLGEQTAADGVLWYQIRFSGSGGAETTGFASSAFIKFPSVITSSSDFENYMNAQGFPDSYKPGLRELHAKYPKWTFTAFQTNLDWETVIQNESIIGRNLVGRENISSWKSTAIGAYDWNTGTWPGFDGSSWVQASEDIIRYYMDPRNFIDEKYIFQFLKQSYDSSLHTREGLESMVSGTFLAGTAGGAGASGNSGNGGAAPEGGNDSPAAGPGASGPGASGPGADTTVPAAPVSVTPVAAVSSHNVDLVTTAYGPGMSSGGQSGAQSGGGQITAPSTGSTSYIDIILNAAIQSGVNPYILASMIIQEQGSQGTGRSISGTVPGYQGYYNFFNIEAYQSGSLGAVERGLWWASQAGSYARPWNSVEASILGGSIYYGSNYVKKGQDTLYLKKFNVQGDNLYKHQYMTNVLAAAAEGVSLSKISSLKNSALEFSIPVYKNMPATASVKPTGDGSPNNKLGGLGADGFALTPTFDMNTESYDLIVDHSVSSVTIAASVIDSSASVSGTGTVNLQSGNNDITVAVKAANGSVRKYVIHVVRQTNGPTYSQNMGSGVTGGNAAVPGGAGPGAGSTTGGSQVEIVAPGAPGTTGSGNTTGPMAPDGSMNGFGTSSGNTGLVGPGGNTVPGSQTPGSGGGSGSGGSGAPAVKGDVNGDGKLNMLDVLKAQRHLLGLETLSGASAAILDINGNGKIDIMDILAMQKDILGIEKLQ